MRIFEEEYVPKDNPLFEVDITNEGEVKMVCIGMVEVYPLLKAMK